VGLRFGNGPSERSNVEVVARLADGSGIKLDKGDLACSGGQAEMAVLMEMEMTGEMRHWCWWWCGGEVDESWWEVMDSGRENGGRPVC